MGTKPQPPSRPPAAKSVSTAEFFTPEYLERRRRIMARRSGFQGMDDLNPKTPAGHADGIRTSTWLTQTIKRTHRKQAMNVSPQEVIDILVAAGVKNWVLMGLHGYVGYLPEPRATQDVDVMVPHGQRKRAVKAIRQAWPGLIVCELSQVVRFMDPNDLNPNGQPKPVIDLMLPWGEFQATILKKYVIIDKETQHRIPRLEAALASKYASMVSRYRDWDRKQQDAVDFRRMVRANHERIDRDDLRRLADQIWEGAGEEIDRFVEIAMRDEPFPV
jgi:hypothetical protein